LVPQGFGHSSQTLRRLLLFRLFPFVLFTSLLSHAFVFGLDFFSYLTCPFTRVLFPPSLSLFLDASFFFILLFPSSVSFSPFLSAKTAGKIRTSPPFLRVTSRLMIPRVPGIHFWDFHPFSTILVRVLWCSCFCLSLFYLHLPFKALFSSPLSSVFFESPSLTVYHVHQ